MNHTRFPKEDHLPYWASGQQSYEGWSCGVPITEMRLNKYTDNGHLTTRPHCRLDACINLHVYSTCPVRSLIPTTKHEPVNRFIQWSICEAKCVWYDNNPHIAEITLTKLRCTHNRRYIAEENRHWSERLIGCSWAISSRRMVTDSQSASDISVRLSNTAGGQWKHSARWRTPNTPPLTLPPRTSLERKNCAFLWEWHTGKRAKEIGFRPFKTQW